MAAAAGVSASQFLGATTSVFSGGGGGGGGAGRLSREPSSRGMLSREPSRNMMSQRSFSQQPSFVASPTSPPAPTAVMNSPGGSGGRGVGPDKSDLGKSGSLGSPNSQQHGSFRSTGGGGGLASSPEPEDIVPAVQITELELENIRRIFKQFDADGSNTIDVEELALVMQSLGVEMDEHQLTSLVEQVTDEGEQELTFEEFVSLITLWKEAAQYKLFEGDGFKSLAKQHVEAALESESIIPDQPWRASWDVLVCIVAVLYWIFVLLLDAYTVDGFDRAGLVAGDVVCTVFLIVDVVVCSRTAFAREGRIIDRKDEVFEKYKWSWLVPDILAALPLDLILTAAGADPTAATVLRHLRLFKMCKVPTLWRTSDVVPITSQYITFHFHLLPIFQLFITFTVMVHGFAIFFVLIKQRNCSDKLIINNCEFPYTPAVYFVIYALSTVGLGDVSVNGELEHWYTCIVLVGAMASNGIVIGKLVQILQRADIKKEQRSKLRETLAVLEHYHIAPQLQTEILQFQAHVFENNLGAAYESIVSDLPAEMRTNIGLFVRMKLVSGFPVFQESHFMLRIAIAQALTNAVARPEQYMTMAGQQVDGLFFLAYGFADAFNTKGHYERTLRSSDYFGDSALVGSEPIISESVKALTYCDLWILHANVFEKLLERFPKFRRTVELLRSMDAAAKATAAAAAHPHSPPSTTATPLNSKNAGAAATDASGKASQGSGPGDASAAVVVDSADDADLGGGGAVPELAASNEWSSAAPVPHLDESLHKPSIDGSASDAERFPLRPRRMSFADKLREERRGSKTTSGNTRENSVTTSEAGGSSRARRHRDDDEVNHAGEEAGSSMRSSSKASSDVQGPAVSVREVEAFLEQVRRFKQKLSEQCEYNVTSF